MVVVVINGFFGNRKKHLDVSDIFDQEVQKIPNAENITVIKTRGGSGIGKLNRIFRRLKEYSKQDRVLLLIGKSYGAHWCVRLLWKLANCERLSDFRAVAMVTVDPAFTLSKMQKKTKPIPKINYAKNFHQYGYRSGYLLGPPAENTALKGKHSTLETRHEVRKAISDLLLWGHAKRKKR